VLLLRLLGSGEVLDARLRLALGIALVAAAGALMLKGVLAARARGEAPAEIVVRPLPTLLIGVVGGLVVGMTSVGSGSLMMVLLLLTYPRLELSQLVGTDLVQAVPLVASAAVAHLIFGNVELGLTGSVLLGALPGVYLGARLSSRAPDALLRPVLVVVLAGSALKLLGASTLWVVLVALGAGAALAAVAAARRLRERAPSVAAPVVEAERVSLPSA
jgi:hypothetical protein